MFKNNENLEPDPIPEVLFLLCGVILLFYIIFKLFL